MKKIILCILTLSLILTFCACAQASNIDPKNDTPQILSDGNQDNSFSAAGSPLNSSGSNGGRGCIVYYPSFRTLEAFNHYVATNTLPMSFVTYQDIAALGEFESLIEMSKGKAYLYSLDIGTEKSLALYVYYNRTLQEELELMNVHYPTETYPYADLRKGNVLDLDYKQNDFYYVYAGGRLLCIIWESNGVLFVLGSEFELADYEGDNVILNMLLTKGDESAQVKAAFDTMIQNKLDQAK